MKLRLAKDDSAGSRAALAEVAKKSWPRNSSITILTYVQAVADEKREAQNNVVKMLLPGIRRSVI